MKSKTGMAVLGIAGVMAVMAALAIFMLPTAQAQESDLASMTTTPFTQAQWDALYPPDDGTNGARSHNNFTGSDVTLYPAGHNVRWTVAMTSDMETYQLERRMIEPDGTSIAEYQMIGEMTPVPVLVFPDATGVQGFEYQYRLRILYGDGGPLPYEKERTVTMQGLRPMYGYPVYNDADDETDVVLHTTLARSPAGAAHAVPPVRNTSASSMQSPPARPCPRESGGRRPPGSASCRPGSPAPAHCPGRGDGQPVHADPGAGRG